PNLRELERRLVTQTASSSPTEPVSLSADAPREAIQLENLTFRYPGANADVLANLDLVIPVGKSLAIVGANGAGKTTLIKLLCRLSDPTAGRILVDGQDLSRIDPRIWQRRVAAIFQ